MSNYNLGANNLKKLNQHNISSNNDNSSVTPKNLKDENLNLSKNLNFKNKLEFSILGDNLKTEEDQKSVY